MTTKAQAPTKPEPATALDVDHARARYSAAEAALAEATQAEVAAVAAHGETATDATWSAVLAARELVSRRTIERDAARVRFEQVERDVESVRAAEFRAHALATYQRALNPIAEFEARVWPHFLTAIESLGAGIAAAHELTQGAARERSEIGASPEAARYGLPVSATPFTLDHLRELVGARLTAYRVSGGVMPELGEVPYKATGRHEWLHEGPNLGRSNPLASAAPVVNATAPAPRAVFPSPEPPPEPHVEAQRSFARQLDGLPS
jgi:hypothetical protein